MCSERNNRQQRAEIDARHDLKNYLDTIIQTSHDGIFVVDSEGRFEFGNEAFFRIFGWPTDEIIGHNFIKVVPPDMHEFILKRWEEVQAGKGEPYEVDIVRKNGERRSLLVSRRHMTIAGQRKYCVVTKDVTESKHIQKTAEFLSLITEQVSDSVLATNLNFEITYVNRIFEHIYGYSRDEVMGQSPDMLNAEPTAEHIQREIYETIMLGETWRGEHLNKRKDGSVFPCEMTIFPLTNDEGETIAYGSLQRDITERRQIEEELSRYRSHLEEMVKTRTEELTEAQETLRKVHRRLLNAGESERRRLAANLHDSAGQKLVAMALGIQQTILSCQDTDAHKSQIQALQNIAQQCTGTIQEIRTICYGLYPPMLEMTGLAPSLGQQGKSCQPAVEFHLTCDEELSEARFDPEQEIALFRIAQEAVSNALRHGDAANITVSLSGLADMVTMTLVDDGVGFDTTSALGQGLGLRSMTERARAADGSLTIISEPGLTSVEASIRTKQQSEPEI